MGFSLPATPALKPPGDVQPARPARTIADDAKTIGHLVNIWFVLQVRFPISYSMILIL